MLIISPGCAPWPGAPPAPVTQLVRGYPPFTSARMTSLLALARPAQSPEPVDHRARQPDIALALVVDSRLEVDAAKGHGSGDRVEGGLSDGNADHGLEVVGDAPRGKGRGAATSPEGPAWPSTGSDRLVLPTQPVGEDAHDP